MKATTSYRTAFIIVTVLFFLWGFITILLDSLIPRLRDIFELSYFQAGLVQFAFFLAYLIFSLPAGFLLSKIGYKRGIIVGLTIMAIGCLLFYPAASYRMFGIFMLGYFALACGITVLQVAANPYVAVLGSEEGASSRLNLAQAINSLGTTLAPLVGAMFLLNDAIKSPEEILLLSETDKNAYLLAEATTVQLPFLLLAASIGLLALVFVFIKLPVIMDKVPRGGYGRLLKNKVVLLGVIGIFVYVGAEVAIGTYLVNYFLSMGLDQTIMQSDWLRTIPERAIGSPIETIDPKAMMGSFVFLYWGGAMVGRFIGAYLTRIFQPAHVLAVFALLAVAMLVLSMSTQGIIAMFSILAVGLFNSIMFPTIFTLTLEGQGQYKPQISGLLCMAIVGGAVIPPLCGYFADLGGFKSALLLLVACYGYILYFGLYRKKMLTPKTT